MLKARERHFFCELTGADHEVRQISDPGYAALQHGDDSNLLHTNCRNEIHLNGNVQRRFSGLHQIRQTPVKILEISGSILGQGQSPISRRYPWGQIRVVCIS